ncbi:MAG: arsenosugar biosynthesis radical SAM protein ArsS [Candidatus Hinthialibacter antarcticus]|nr:arsenosugar biosynthesis radical SAM protein ArsS [Candidatus Hinthialibacter antarcticus]
MNLFDQKIIELFGQPMHGASIDVFQVNVGLKCNQACVHCHVKSSPSRKEMMTWETMRQVIDAARRANSRLVDITGGAPEIHPHLKRFIQSLRSHGFEVQVRTNLTILLEDGYTDFPEFFKEQNVHLVASLPCYLQENVDKQRGDGVYEGSVKALQRLNEIGYGVGPDMQLNLVYNPLGPYLPPNQATLEQDYRRELRDRFGVSFTQLLTITNMPIGRFQTDLRRQKKDKDYMDMLVGAFNNATVDGLMCRHQVNVDWDGVLYDCDFNLALKIPVNHGAPNHIKNFDPAVLATRRIETGEHCFGCTAGCGSSCSGAVLP